MTLGQWRNSNTRPQAERAQRYGLGVDLPVCVRAVDESGNIRESELLVCRNLLDQQSRH